MRTGAAHDCGQRDIEPSVHCLFHGVHTAAIAVEHDLIQILYHFQGLLLGIPRVYHQRKVKGLGQVDYLLKDCNLAVPGYFIFAPVMI